MKKEKRTKQAAHRERLAETRTVVEDIANDIQKVMDPRDLLDIEAFAGCGALLRYLDHRIKQLTPTMLDHLEEDAPEWK